jgi:hypothetical protein
MLALMKRGRQEFAADLGALKLRERDPSQIA